MWLRIRQTAGKLTGFVHVMRDITERSDGGGASKSEQRFRRLVDSNIIGVIVADMEHIIEANDTFLQMIGYTRDELRRNEINWQTITPPEYVAADRKGLEEMLSRGAPHTVPEGVFPEGWQSCSLSHWCFYAYS